MMLSGENSLCFEGVLSGVKLYFCVSVNGAKAKLFTDNSECADSEIKICDASKKFGAVFDCKGFVFHGKL